MLSIYTVFQSRGTLRLNQCISHCQLGYTPTSTKTQGHELCNSVTYLTAWQLHYNHIDSWSWPWVCFISLSCTKPQDAYFWL